MTEKRKPGRPKGSGEGLDVVVTTRLRRDVVAVVDAEGEAEGKDRSAVVREIVTRWAGRQKGKAKE